MEYFLINSNSKNSNSNSKNSNKFSDYNIALDNARRLILEQKIIALPTETVYGLAADFYSQKAIDAIYAAKNRDYSSPLSAHVSSVSMIEELCTEIPDYFYAIAEVFLPGPMAIILKRKPDVPDYAARNTDTLGIRFPDEMFILDLISSIGRPLAATSVNYSTEKSLTEPEEIRRLFSGKIDAVFDGGRSKYAQESTVLNLVGTPKILRHGCISAAEIEDVLNIKIIT